jgi:hypothetical protein
MGHPSRILDLTIEALNENDRISAERRRITQWTHKAIFPLIIELVDGPIPILISKTVEADW